MKQSATIYNNCENDMWQPADIKSAMRMAEIIS